MTEVGGGRCCEVAGASARCLELLGAARSCRVPCGRRGQVAGKCQELPGGSRFQVGPGARRCQVPGAKRCQVLRGARRCQPKRPRSAAGPPREPRECHQLLDSRRKGRGHQSQGANRASRRPHNRPVVLVFFFFN